MVKKNWFGLSEALQKALNDEYFTESFHSDGTCTTNLGKFTLLKSVPVGMPNVLTPGGLSNERQSYLKEKVAPLMPLEYRDSISSS
ncbi:hypothetical protein EB796_011976 [Bugula neritina]|uniref:Uncharacterized protein n=1 Tax=Bugula neritina TaxID=10212 RepID=A0A7J7JWK1_BUGNE|nr:hypothetical protein EB796_011976 [Bugula neritina]